MDSKRSTEGGQEQALQWATGGSLGEVRCQEGLRADSALPRLPRLNVTALDVRLAKLVVVCKAR